jgi:hypothetical protein
VSKTSRMTKAPSAMVKIPTISGSLRRVDARFQDERGSDRVLLLLPESMEGANASVHVGVIYERRARRSPPEVPDLAGH